MAEEKSGLIGLRDLAWAAPNRLRALAAAMPWGVRAGLWGVLASLALPWLLRAYSAWWDLAFGRSCHALETFLPMGR